MLEFVCLFFVVTMSKRGKWCMQNLSIDADLLQHLQSNVDFLQMEEKELESSGFTKCVDQPALPNHIYYEGYFHGLEVTSGAVHSINPRRGEDMMKPAAPLPLRAFLAVFRERNAFWLRPALKGTFIDSLSLTPNVLSDLAVQFHFGDHMGSEHVVWHYDAVNSMLHLALSLHGSRSLYYERNKLFVETQSSQSTEGSYVQNI